VWRYFIKGLHQSSSTKATVVSAAINYCTSALLGFLVFSEKTPVLWWFGTILVISGLLLVLSDEKEKPKVE
jgi:drug/metabolite transporter (DMT)-like permease